MQGRDWQEAELRLDQGFQEVWTATSTVSNRLRLSLRRHVSNLFVFFSVETQSPYYLWYVQALQPDNLIHLNIISKLDWSWTTWCFIYMGLHSVLYKSINNHSCASYINIHIQYINTCVQWHSIEISHDAIWNNGKYTDPCSIIAVNLAGELHRSHTRIHIKSSWINERELSGV